MSKNLLLGFVPWLLYLFISSNNIFQFKIAITVSLFASIVCQIPELKKGFILSWGTLTFFIFMFITVVLLNAAWVIQHAGYISNSILAIIAFISIMIGKPFTMQYAKETVSADKWESPLFKQINYLLSGFWLILFSIGFGVYVFRLHHPSTNNWIYNIITYLTIIIGSSVSIWFPDWYKKNYLKKSK